MIRFLLTGFWLATTSLTLVLSFFFVLATPTTATRGSVQGISTAQNVEVRTNYHVFTALPAATAIEEQPILEDASVEILRQFLHKYNSPLEPHAQALTDTAKKYHLDFRLLPAIAMQESGLCRVIPNDSFNCWGYGIYGDKITRFTSYEEAIETVAKGLGSNYVSDGLSTPELIMARYTPSSDGSWARAVRSFMEEME